MRGRHDRRDHAIYPWPIRLRKSERRDEHIPDRCTAALLRPWILQAPVREFRGSRTAVRNDGNRDPSRSMMTAASPGAKKLLRTVLSNDTTCISERRRRRAMRLAGSSARQRARCDSRRTAGSPHTQRCVVGEFGLR
jgi:hypothetical protein